MVGINDILPIFVSYHVSGNLKLKWLAANPLYQFRGGRERERERLIQKGATLLAQECEGSFGTKMEVWTGDVCSKTVTNHLSLRNFL